MAIRMSGMVAGMDTESIVTELMKAENLKKTKIQNKITTAEWKQDKWKTLNSKIYSFYTGALSKLKMQGTFNTKKVTSSDESKATVTSSALAPTGAQSLKIDQLATAQIVTGGQLSTTGSVTTSTNLVTGLKMTSGTTITAACGTKTKTLTIDPNSTVNDVVQTFKDVGLNANYDATQGRFFISSKNSGDENSFDITTSKESDLALLGLNTIVKQADGTFSTGSGGAAMTMVKPTDSIVELNGVKITSATNVVTVNGLTITLKALTDGANTTSDTTDDKPINIGIATDTQAVYDMVKSFVKSYNELLDEMNDDYDAETAKGYEPLTDDQKETMTDDQIEKWETKIKDSLLRRDGTVGSLISAFRSSFSQSIKVDNKSYSLASFGIDSANYTEKGQLHIDGDSDDSLVSSKTNKLMDALNSEPDKVAAVLNGLANTLYTTLTKDMKSTQLRSALTVYNDKELKKQITDYKKDLSTLEDKLQDTETRYYKQFSAMESAMAKMNSQSSSLSSMLGN